jgi:cell division FtsZ-interacting protein ZapD
MANINVRKRLENISDDLEKVLQHITNYSGVPEKDAIAIDNLATTVAELGARILAAAQAAQGYPSPEHIVRNVRKALGFTNP